MNAHMTTGTRVIYVPKHANGNIAHAACERGIVERQSEMYAFVRFGSDTTVKGCFYSDLVIDADFYAKEFETCKHDWKPNAEEPGVFECDKCASAVVENKCGRCGHVGLDSIWDAEDIGQHGYGFVCAKCRNEIAKEAA